MYISFYLDSEFYSGDIHSREIRTSVVDNPNVTRAMILYEVDLGIQLQFAVVMGKDGLWISDDHINPRLVECVGAEIERREEAFEKDILQPVKYSSSLYG